MPLPGMGVPVGAMIGVPEGVALSSTIVIAPTSALSVMTVVAFCAICVLSAFSSPERKLSHSNNEPKIKAMTIPATSVIGTPPLLRRGLAAAPSAAA